MKKEHQGIAIVIVAIIVIVPVSGILLNMTLLRWPYADGTVLSFKLTTSGYNNYAAIPYSYLNGTLLHANITTLPSLDQYSIGFSFDDILTTICTTTFLNSGSLAPSYLNALISRSVIPVGVYHTIDSWFDDAPEGSGNTNFSSMTQNQLEYGFYHDSVDKRLGWKCTINTTTGYPVSVEFWRSEVCPGTNHSYRIVLTLVTPE